VIPVRTLHRRLRVFHVHAEGVAALAAVNAEECVVGGAGKILAPVADLDAVVEDLSREAIAAKGAVNLVDVCGYAGGGKGWEEGEEGRGELHGERYLGEKF